MPAPKGNRFWEARSSHGRKKKFATPAKLWAACVEYFEWVEANPLWEARLISFQGESSVEYLPKMRAMTVSGLCLFLDISEKNWYEDYCKREDFCNITTRAENYIREQKFTGAAAELLNPNIIARDLGLTDKQAHDHSGGVTVINYDERQSDN